MPFELPRCPIAALARRKIRTVIQSAAIIFGTKGLGRWQAVKLRSLLAKCVEDGIRIIPVLLPGVDDIPKSQEFLGQYRALSFEKSLNETDRMDELVWGITGKRLI